MAFITLTKKIDRLVNVDSMGNEDSSRNFFGAKLRPYKHFSAKFCTTESFVRREAPLRDDNSFIA